MAEPANIESGLSEAGPEVSGKSAALSASETFSMTNFLVALTSRNRFDEGVRLALFAVSPLFFVIAASLGTAPADLNTINILNYSHLGIPVLAVGITVLPARHLIMAAVVFLASFLIAELILLVFSGSSGWTALGMMKSLIEATCVGLASGVVARSHYYGGGDRNEPKYPELLGLACGAAVVTIGWAVGILSLWVELHTDLYAAEFGDLAFVMVQRILRLGMIAAGLVLLLRAPPKLETAPEVALLMGAFTLLGLLNRAGYSMVPSIDPAILGLFLFLFRPVRVATAGTLGGICIYIALTGVYLELPTSVDIVDMKDNVLGNILLIVLVFLATMRLQSQRLEHNQLQALGRMARLQGMARYGHFRVDVLDGSLFFDELTQHILGVPERMTTDQFRQMVPAQDRDYTRALFTPIDKGGVALSFRFNMGDGSGEREKFRNLACHAISDTLDDGRVMNYGFLGDVTQERVQEERLRTVLAELSERQGQQTQLFSVISHELRTPASIVSMLADEMDEGRPWAVVGPKMRTVVDQLLSVLADMRQAVRPEENLPVRIESFRPADLAHNLVEVLKPIADAHGVQMVLQLDLGAQSLRSTDRMRLNQTLSNLLKNSLVHSQATEVVLRFSTLDNGFCVWTVSDNGRNLPVTQRDNLFQPFVRSKAEGMQTDGSGLGLFIAKSAMELLGGKLEYVNRPLSGAEFRITLNMPVVTEQALKASQATDGTPLKDLSQLSALVLEDSETMGELLVSRLAREFREVKWLRDGASGLAWLSLHSADVVITDLYMPGMNGDELAQKLRKKGLKCPIIGMTAADAGEDVERFRKSGVNKVLTKPVRPKDLRQALG